MPRRKTLFLLALLAICIVAIFQLLTYTINSLFLHSPTNKKPISQSIKRSRIVQYDTSIKYGPRFIDSDKLPKLGPQKRQKKLDSLRIIEDGKIIEGVDVNGPIFIEADNVVIRDFTAYAIIQSPTHTGMLLEDGKVDGHSTDNDGIRWSNFTAKRIEITNVVDGIKAHGDVLLEDVWVHDLATSVEGKTDLHNDCVQISAGSNVVINHSRFERCGNNSAIFIKSDQGEIDNVVVKNNILDSGNYTVAVLTSPAKPGVIPKSINIINNLFFHNARYGLFNINVPVTITGNVDDKGKAVNY